LRVQGFTIGDLWVRLTLIVIAILFVAGCSRISLLYGYAETALTDEADFFLDLDDADEVLVSRSIDVFLAWHSAEMLPRYARFMTAQAAIVDTDTVDGDTAAAAVVTLRQLLDDLVKGAAPHVAAVLATQMLPDKLRYFEARMAERLDERREELAEPAEERLQARIERVTENFERLTGDLNDDQVAMIRDYAAEAIGGSALWLSTREKRERAFVAFLASQPDEARISAFMYKIVMRGHEIVDPSYEAISEKRWRRFQGLLAAIMTSLTPEQRAEVSTTLRGYAAELLDLSG
jgi:hypothetical protein